MAVLQRMQQKKECFDVKTKVEIDMYEQAAERSKWRQSIKGISK